MKYELKENSQLELKEKLTDTFLKTVSAFSNYDGGVIVFGIEDKTSKITGIKNPQKFRLQVEQKINDSIVPRPKYKLEEEFRGGETLVKVKVLKGENPPYMYKSETYQRIDTSTVKVDRNELIRLTLWGQDKTYDSMPSPNQKLTFTTLENEFLNMGDDIKITIDVLKTLNLYQKESFNIAALLISDENDLDTSEIGMVKFKNGTSIIEDRKTIKKCSIINQFNEANIFFNKHCPPIEISEKIRRVKKAPIPTIAFRETLANAIVHRDYLIKGMIQVAYYDNRIEIISWGGLVKDMSEEAFYNDNLSILRNPIIAQVFRRLGLIEAFGTGIKKIIKSYEETQFRPAFVIKDKYIKVVLPNIYFDDSKFKEEEKIINYLQINQKITRLEVEKILNVSKDKAYAILNQMVKNEKILLIEQGPSSFYELK